MELPSKQITARFYRTASGREPVREWLKRLDPEDRHSIGVDIMDIEFSWPIGMPLCRKLTGHINLWEVRSNITNKRIARVFFHIDGNEMILLHGYIKTAQKTPQKEISLAVKRQKEYVKHGWH